MEREMTQVDGIEIERVTMVEFETKVTCRKCGERVSEREAVVIGMGHYCRPCEQVLKGRAIPMVA